MKRIEIIKDNSSASRAGCVAFIVVLGLAYAGWFAYFRASEDLKETAAALNELRATIGGGWPVEL
jgi:uncharacterized protein HemX